MAPLKLMFGGTIFFWLYLLFVVPVIHDAPSRGGAPDRALEVLLHLAKSGEAQVVIGKFLAAFVFTCSCGCRPGCTLRSSRATPRSTSGRSGGIPRDRAARVAVPLRGPAHLSPGRNQIIAAIFGFAVLVVVFSLGLVENLVTGEALKAPSVT